MSRSYIFIAACTLLLPPALYFYPTEGHVSQVSLQTITLVDILPHTQHIVKVTYLNKSESFKHIIFPADTSPMGKETIYEEGVHLYQVEEVITSPSLKPGETIHVWTRPTYGESLIKASHEGGGIKSIYEERYQPDAAPAANQSHILLLGETLHGGSKNHPITAYRLKGKEGLTTAPKIQKMLQALPSAETANSIPTAPPLVMP